MINEDIQTTVDADSELRKHIYKKSLGLIRTKLSKRGMLELLAEEASELSQAALKMIRLSNNDAYPVNPHKYNEQACADNLMEEFTDVLICADLLFLFNSPTIRQNKIESMIERIGGFDE